MSPSETPWWKTGVLYQIYPRSWADGNGDGIGDFAGMIDRLHHLVELGVDAVWVSPFYPSPLADFGYDVSDYCGVDPIYGDLASFDRFVDRAHALGLKVVIDWVPNHTSDQHPWFRSSRSSRSDPRRGWYVWRDPRPDGSPPNNWPSVFGGPAWTFDAATGQYYLHSFLAEQPDLDWRNPEVEAAMLGTLRFWLDRGVDGFRIDVVLRCMKDPRLRDLPPAWKGRSPVFKQDAEYAAFDHLHDAAHPDIHPLLQRLRRVVDQHPGPAPRVLIGEIHELDWPRWASYFGRGDELHLPFNFALLQTGLDPEAIRRAVVGLEAALPSGAWPNWVLGNHDEPRVTRRLGWAQSKVAAMLLLTLRGTPTLYYGDEIGLLEADIPPERQQDPWGRRKPGFGRDGCRTPMQWERGPRAGFSPANGSEPWLPVAHPERLSVQAERGDPSSHLELYRRLLGLRRARPALHLGDIEVIGPWERPHLLTYLRTHGGDRVAVALNLSSEAVTWDPGEVGGQVLVSIDHRLEGSTPRGPLRLGPWEGVVIG